MMIRRMIALGLALGLMVPLGALAAEVDCDGLYCFGTGDFSGEELTGVCITGLPEKALGAVMLGDREIRPGDILAAEQLEKLTFSPALREQDAQSTIRYLPVFSGAVGPEAELTISIRGKENQPPVAEDFAAETYKNPPIEGKLKVKDPEGEAMTFTLVRQPKRGQVEIREDGSFTYTPKKNKVGIDSFTFTATDPAGKTSREATVTLTVIKPADAAQYTDTVGLDCRFAAEWMKNTGIFTGETLSGNPCFNPEKAVTRGEFVTMLVKSLEIPAEETVTYTGYSDESPLWLQPYLAAAVRAGLTAGLQEQETFCPNDPITLADAAVMLQNALDLSAPVFSEEAELGADTHLTRGSAAKILYQAAQARKATEEGL